MERGRAEELRRRLNENCSLTEEDLRPKKFFDAILPIAYAGEQLMKELELLEPFGKGNEKPLFAAGNLTVKSAGIIGRNANVLKTVLTDGSGHSIEALSFGEVEKDLAYIRSREKISILYYPEMNEYQGKRTVQLRIESYR